MINYIVRDVPLAALSADDKRPRIFVSAGQLATRKRQIETSIAAGTRPENLFHKEHPSVFGEFREDSGGPWAYALVLTEKESDVPVPVASGDPKAANGSRKVALHLVPPALSIEAAQSMYDGAVVRGYGPFNWRAGKVNASVYAGAILRHAFAFLDGEDVDPESPTGATHLGAIAANVGILADAREHGALVDDRVKGPAGAAIRARTKKTVPEPPKTAEPPSVTPTYAPAGYVRRRRAPDRMLEEDQLIALLGEGREAAWHVRSGEGSQKMRVMTRRERRILHAFLDSFPDVATKSHGTEPNRYIEVRDARSPLAKINEDARTGRTVDLSGVALGRGLKFPVL